MISWSERLDNTYSSILYFVLHEHFTRSYSYSFRISKGHYRKYYVIQKLKQPLWNSFLLRYIGEGGGLIL